LEVFFFKELFLLNRLLMLVNWEYLIQLEAPFYF